MSERDVMKARALKGDFLYSPMLNLRRGRTDKSNVLATAIRRLMQADPDRLWTLSEFARQLRKSRHTIYLVTMDMRGRTPPEIALVDESGGLYGVPSRHQETKKSASVRMIERLITAGPMRLVVLEKELCCRLAAPIFRLRKVKVLKPADHTRKSRIDLTEDARAMVRAGWTARDLTKIRARPV
jgi:hypothetical protein